MAGFNTPAPQFLAAGLLALTIASFLRGGRRWLAYIAFLLASFGAAISFIFWRGTSNIPNWSFEIMIITNTVTALLLFFTLWRAKPQQVNSTL
ncbi:MAG: hypothetical protein U5K75_10370 [Ahrensia sp.]|nr:hypothetical protein [Ahrensia sp.]